MIHELRIEVTDIRSIGIPCNCKKREFYVNGLHYTVRSAIDKDAADLSD